MNSEFIRCDECQCWNKKHWVYKEEIERDGRIKNPKFAICQRRAPSIVLHGHRETSSIYTRIFGLFVWTGFHIYRQNTRVLPHMREDEGCWEGIRKEKVEQCDIV